MKVRLGWSSSSQPIAGGLDRIRARLKNLQHPRSALAKVPSLRGDLPILHTIHGLHHAPGEAERIP